MKTIALYAAAAIASISPATAATVYPSPMDTLTRYYTLTGPVGGYSATWQLPAFPAPSSWVEDQGFALERVEGVFAGTIEGDAYLDFFSAANGGGLSISDADGPDLLVSLIGAQLYFGPEDAPKTRRGIFALTDSNGVGGYTLTVANAFGGVPEPATWGLMILGMAAVGGAMRARVRRATVRFA